MVNGARAQITGRVVMEYFSEIEGGERSRTIEDVDEIA